MHLLNLAKIKTDVLLYLGRRLGDSGAIVLLLLLLFVCLFLLLFLLLLFVVVFFAFPSYISGVHHFWVRFLRM